MLKKNSFRGKIGKSLLTIALGLAMVLTLLPATDMTVRAEEEDTQTVTFDFSSKEAQAAMGEIQSVDDESIENEDYMFLKNDSDLINFYAQDQRLQYDYENDPYYLYFYGEDSELSLTADDGYAICSVKAYLADSSDGYCGFLNHYYKGEDPETNDFEVDPETECVCPETHDYELFSYDCGIKEFRLTAGSSDTTARISKIEVTYEKIQTATFDFSSEEAQKAVGEIKEIQESEDSSYDILENDSDLINLHVKDDDLSYSDDPYYFEINGEHSDFSLTADDECLIQSVKVFLADDDGYFGFKNIYTDEDGVESNDFDVSPEGKYIFSNKHDYELFTYSSGIKEFKLTVESSDYCPWISKIEVTYIDPDADTIQAVTDKIDAIGEVVYTDECKGRIDEARSAYDALSDVQKGKVSEEEYQILTDAETAYADLKEAAAKAKAQLNLNKGLKITQTGSKVNMRFGKVTGAAGYQVYGAYCGSKLKLLKTVKSTKATIKKLNGKKLNLKKNYKFRIVAYKLVDGKKTAYVKSIPGHVVGRKNAKYTNAKKIKLTKTSFTLSAGKTAKVKAKTVLVARSKKQLTNAHAKESRYATSDKAVATVSSKGVIKGLKTGTCYVYVFSRNGLAKRAKVTVK